MAGAYIHIPFCVQKCRYCDFPSFARLSDASLVESYIVQLENEIRLRASAEPYNSMRFDTVFFGGGTPSALPAGILARISAVVSGALNIAPGAEFTIECNPGTLTLEKLKEYRGMGANRLSMGVQSMSDALLSRLGRIHTADEVEKSVTMARAAGFANLNADMMYGLPGQTVIDVELTAKRLCALGFSHISAYSLILEEGTLLYKDVAGGSELLPADALACDMHEAAIMALTGLGYERYEISNYAKTPPGRCRHNINYWQNGEYLGVGLGAHSACRKNGAWTREYNAADFENYLKADFGAREEQIARREEMFECVMLATRMAAGLDKKRFLERFGVSFDAAYKAAAAACVKKGYAINEAGFFRLTPRGLDMQNDALMEFLDYN